jgi:hypothetical protein
VAAATRRALVAAALVLVASPAAGAGDDGKRDAPALRVEAYEVRLSWFDQAGRGYQSRADTTPGVGPGDEALTVFQPQLMLRLRQSPLVHHDLQVSIDIVTSASADGLDAISTASRVNEAGTIAVDSSIEGARGTTTFRYGVHVEEPLRSIFAGAGYVLRLADDNATLGGNASLTYDYFDKIDQFGEHHGQVSRVSANANLEASQVLSPTTIVWGGYGLTLQAGVLENTWNAVPTRPGDAPLQEMLPGRRVRHALSGRLAQRLPWTDSTLRLGYRYYRDDFGLRAHTAEAKLYQGLGAWLMARASVRYHHQSGVDYFVTSLPSTTAPLAWVTSDSDLARFDAWQLGGALFVDGARAPFRWLGRGRLELSYDWYSRSNDLRMHVFALSYGRGL